MTKTELPGSRRTEPPGEREGAVDFARDGAAPFLVDVHVDGAGFIWTMVTLADSDWAPVEDFGFDVARTAVRLDRRDYRS